MVPRAEICSARLKDSDSIEIFEAGFFFTPGGSTMAKVELKQPIVEEISGYVKDAQSVVLVDYRGLTVAQDTELRKQLRDAGVT